MARQGPIAGNEASVPGVSQNATVAPLAVHATAVAIDGRAVLIRGPSKVGKSTLALALIEGSTPAQPVTLIGDDRIILSRRGDDVLASPHPRIAGLIEKRGYGILSMPYAFNIPLAGVIDLRLDENGPASSRPRSTTCRFLEKEFPSLYLYPGSRGTGHGHEVLDWVTATLAAHLAQKARARPCKRAKD
ncbi:MAG: HPr kinase/phosphatase C-terminal domain-containing protein [Beijerinckiaceae bacterium]|nr:HPr kinase/phosphatase C-terminal domain-containing protein [Beijerinckiaceae bacterium]